MARKPSKDIDEYNTRSPTKNWDRTALGANIVEWMLVENGELTDKRLKLVCERNISDRFFKCTLSRYRFIEAFRGPRKAIAFAKSYMKTHRV